MSSSDDARVLNNATSQLDRVRTAPAPGIVQVDGRSLAQLISFGAEYGALIAFYDLENQVSGNWEAFYASDPAVAQAMHAALDLPDIERALYALLEQIREALEGRGWQPLLERLFAALARLLGILDRMPVMPGDAQALVARFAPHARTDTVADPLARLHRHLGKGHFADQLQQGYDRGRHWIDALYDILEDFVATLIAELRNGAAEAVVQLDHSLHSDGHAPQAAVYNAFAMQFAEARATLNGFPQRLVQFYYNDVLEQHDLPAQPDQLFLAFTRTPNVDQASVPRGALFPAGTDSKGAAINYAADSALEVSPAAVKSINIHRVTYASVGPVPVPSGVLSGAVALDPHKPTSATPFPMFGLSAIGTDGALTMTQATLGFCVGSQLLMLAGGTRTVSVGLIVSPKATRVPHADPTMDGVTALAQAIKANMELHYSTAGGWVAVDGFDVKAELLLGSFNTLFTISFVLPADAPGLLAIDAKPPPNAPKPTLPADAFPAQPGTPIVVATVKVDDNEQPFAFALLSATQFDEIIVNVAVEGLDGLTLTTPNGPADTSQNFAVFGLPPTQGATLDIYAPELFVKPLETCSVTITWAGLPVTATGFYGYYINYLINADGVISPFPLFDNTSFRVGFNVADPGYWDVDPSEQAWLFSTGVPVPTPTASVSYANLAPSPAAPVAFQSVLEIPGVLAQSSPPYYNPTSSALQIVLTQPNYAFGNILYSSNLMYASQKAIPTPTPTPPPSSAGSGTSAPSAAAAVDLLSKVNAAIPDRSYATEVAGAVKGAISSLTGEALAAVRQAIGQSSASAITQSSWFQDLEATLAEAAPAGSSWFSWLTGGGDVVSDAIAALDALTGWVSAHEHEVGTGSGGPAVAKAKTLLASANGIAAAHKSSAGQSPALARANMGAAAQQAQIIVLPPALPNPPWLPMASALTVDYTSALAVQIKTQPGPSMPPPTASGGAATIELNFWHIGPFDALQSPTPTDGGANLLPDVHNHAALYIELTVPVTQVALLFILSAGPNGWWDDPPDMVWEERIDDQWKSCTVLDDTTGGLKNSGIVTLAPTVPKDATKPPLLRVRACGDTNNAPIVQSVIANALTATWDGPGGAEELGIPKPPGTISKSLAKLPGVASIAQPMQSFGGAPPATGRDFDKWMAERLRHKNYAIDAWDYARLALQAAPTVWQAGVVPATDEKTGWRASGKVWVVLVAGPHTPNVIDKTIPQTDLSTLSEVGQMLAACTSPFVEVVVTNPPYLRLTVHAVLEFSDENTSAFWIELLNAELILWLSPWPDPTLGPRPANYYTRRAISEFIRHRPYVQGITRLDVRPEPGTSGNGHYYFTSALQHDLSVPPVNPHPSPAPCCETAEDA